MSKIEWDDSFSVNNAEIDSQHKKWIEIHNKLHESITSGDVTILDIAGAKALKAMYDFAWNHFEFEEEYMRKINYPDIMEHHRLHKDFANLLYPHFRDAQEGKLVLTSTIAKLIKNWLLDHIATEDKKYALFLEEERCHADIISK